MKASTRDVIIGIGALLISAALLLSPSGERLFVPFEGCEGFLHFYYYLVAYALLIGGIFFILRSCNVIRYED